MRTPWNRSQVLAELDGRRGLDPSHVVAVLGVYADASVDDVRAWAGTLHSDSSKIAAALEGLDGATLRDELELSSIGKPPRSAAGAADADAATLAAAEPKT